MIFTLAFAAQSHPIHSSNKSYAGILCIFILFSLGHREREMWLDLNWNWNMIFRSNTKCAYIIFNIKLMFGTMILWLGTCKRCEYGILWCRGKGVSNKNLLRIYEAIETSKNFAITHQYSKHQGKLVISFFIYACNALQKFLHRSLVNQAQSFCLLRIWRVPTK